MTPLVSPVLWHGIKGEEEKREEREREREKKRKEKTEVWRSRTNVEATEVEGGSEEREERREHWNAYHSLGGRRYIYKRDLFLNGRSYVVVIGDGYHEGGLIRESPTMGDATVQLDSLCSRSIDWNEQ